MRYYGTLTGKITDRKKKKVYQEGEEPDTYMAYSAEIVDVTDENGNKLGNFLIRATQKTTLGFYICPNNLISFDCRTIENGVITGIRNICPTYSVACGQVLQKKGLACSFCKYEKKQADCQKYKV